MSMSKNSMGLDGCVWFMGIVESRQDPLNLRRVRVRAFGWHDDSLSSIPSDHLPWAQVLASINAPRDDDMVFGIFLDGRSAQQPLILGIINGVFSQPNNPGKGFNDLREQTELKSAPRFIQSAQYKTDGSGIKITEQSAAPRHPTPLELNNPTISGVAFNKPAGTVIQQRQNNLDTGIRSAGQTWSEPKPAYAPVYPYNQVYASESGHVLEVDDTPGHERLAVQHRTGSFIEWFPTGSVVEKVTKTKYSIIMGDDNIHVMGKCRITVSGDAYIQVVGDCNLEVDSNLNAGVAGDVNFSVGGSFNVKADELNLESTDMNIKADSLLMGGGSYASIVADQVQIDGSDITIEQGGETPSTPTLSDPPSTGQPNRGNPSSD